MAFKNNKTHQLDSVYGNSKLFAIYPAHWKDKWGQPPVLGHVKADDEFYAVRRAYDERVCNWAEVPAKAVQVEKRIFVKPKYYGKPKQQTR